MTSHLLQLAQLPQSLRCLCRCISTRHSNLGKLTNYLVSQGVPNLLQTPLESKYIDDNIKLRLFPTTHPYIPVLQGRNKYRASMNAIRLLANKFVLRKGTRLRINAVSTILQEETSKYNCITTNDRLVVKWQSCAPHAGEEEMGKDHEIALVRDVRGIKASSPVINHIMNPATNKLTNEIESTQRPRFVRGIFIFEFNKDNSSILVHTIDSVEMVDFEKKVQTNALASV
ncbi:uncharacterized protein ZBIST_1189 [Zygosaccharomyces bailii]|nr:uncharacterized protein ZBIST_1189 [Zygosaccharomyces bailii]